MSTEPKPEWLTRLERWKANGTLSTMDRLMEAGTTVDCPRSSGGTSPGKVTGIGHAGLSVHVSLDGGGHKLIGTEVLISHNPTLFPAESSR